MGRGSSRNFLAALLLFLSALLILGMALRTTVRNGLNKQAFEKLENDANVLSDLTAAYHTEGGIHSIQFIINLDLTARVSGADAVLCDATGKIILCSDSPTGCIHQGYHLTKDYLNTILQNGGSNDISTLLNLYDDVRYLSAKPVYTDAGQLIGIVIVSSPVEETNSVVRQLTHVFILCVAVILLCGSVLMRAATRRQSQPLREMARTARAFGHGELDARVHLTGDYTEDIEELALAFNNMASSLQKSEYSRQEFVANVSHELKTPMTTIGGYIDGI